MGEPGAEVQVLGQVCKGNATVTDKETGYFLGNEAADEWAGRAARSAVRGDAAGLALTLQLKKARHVFSWLAEDVWPDSKASEHPSRQVPRAVDGRSLAPWMTWAG